MDATRPRVRLESVLALLVSSGDGRQLIEVAAEHELNAAERLVVVLDGARDELELVERVPVDHGDLVDDELLALAPVGQLVLGVEYLGEQAAASIGCRGLFALFATTTAVVVVLSCWTQQIRVREGLGELSVSVVAVVVVVDSEAGERVESCAADERGGHARARRHEARLARQALANDVEQEGLARAAAARQEDVLLVLAYRLEDVLLLVGELHEKVARRRRRLLGRGETRGAWRGAHSTTAAAAVALVRRHQVGA